MSVPAGPSLPPRRRRAGRLLALAACLGGALAAAVHFGLVALPGGTEADAPPPAASPVAKAPDAIVVTTTPAVPRSVERRVRTVGTLHGFEEIDVSPLVDGRVKRIVHDVGDVVAPGEALLEIDDADIRLALREAERALELELAALGLSTPPDEAFDISRLPSVERAEIMQRDAADTLERFRGLVESAAITKDQLQKAEVAFDAAVLDRRQRLLEAERALAAVRHREAMLETARKRLADTVVAAPSVVVRSFAAPGDAGTGGPAEARSYTVAERRVDEGEVVRAVPPAILFRLVVEDVLKLRAAVPERYAAAVRAGQEVDLEVESLPGAAVRGRVVRVNPTIDTASRTFDVEVQVPNPDHGLKPGAFAKASILLERRGDAVTVPEEALVRFAGVTKLFVVEDGRARAVAVEPGERIDVPGDGIPRRWVEIPHGVPAGSEVVVTGHGQLADGAAVRVRGGAAEAAR